MKKCVMLAPTSFFLTPVLRFAISPLVTRMQAIVATPFLVYHNGAVRKVHVLELLALAEYVPVLFTDAAYRQSLSEGGETINHVFLL